MNTLAPNDLAQRFIRYQESIANTFQIQSNFSLSPEIAAFAKKLENDAKRFSEALITPNMSALIAWANLNKPSNYFGLMIDQQFDLIELSRIGNFGTVEVMPPEVIKILLDAGTSINDLNAVLDSNSGILLQRLDVLLGELSAIAELEEYSYLLMKSKNAFESGHFEASQALSTVLWDSYLCFKAGSTNPISKLKPRAEKPNIDQLETFSPLYDFGAYGPAIKTYQTGIGKDIYSRNATVHGVSRKALSELNSIKALTIAGGLLGRQLKVK